MEQVAFEDYRRFVSEKKSVIMGEQPINIGNAWNIEDFGPPEDYVPESETVWSFPKRGKWATHSGNYRGNWSPYIPRNLILKYTEPNDVVLDQMMGSGTTLIECKLLGRIAYGVDVNRDAVMLSLDRLNFCFSSIPQSIRAFVGDARNLNLIEDDSIDLVATHPPYAGIVRYAEEETVGDLSNFHRIDDYLEAMKEVAKETFRVLKYGKCCAILIGDTRKHLHYVPISVRILEKFLDEGFVLKEDIIKLQWKTKKTRERWRGKTYKFYKIAHEHLDIFRKPFENENIRRLKYSSKWH